MTTSSRPVEQRSDHAAALGAVLAFSMSLGVATLALPLLALAAGYDPVAIGFLTATSAIAQFGLRLRLPQLLGRYPDRLLIALSCVMMASSYGLLLISTSLPAFVVAQLLQGGARALFWTASQTHAVRSPGIPVRMLAQVGTVGNIGTMIGPAVTGLAASYSLQAALLFGVAIGGIGALVSTRLARLEPYQRRERHGEPRLWRREGIDVACWAGFAGGGWRALIGSYVPVVLTGGGLTPGIIGALLAAADGAATVATFALVRLPPRLTRLSLDLSVLLAGVGLAALPLVAGNVLGAAILLVLSGAGAGPLMTLGVAVARGLVHADEEGDAIALVGTFRAAALLVTPAAFATTLALVSVSIGAGLAVASIAITVPATVLAARQRL